MQKPTLRDLCFVAASASVKPEPKRTWRSGRSHPQGMLARDDATPLI